MEQRSLNAAITTNSPLITHAKSVHQGGWAKIVPIAALREHMVVCVCKIVEAVITHVIQLLVVTKMEHMERHLFSIRLSG